MTPREIAIAEARRNKLREAFRGLDGNDALSGDPAILAKQRQGKARAANIAWLSNSSGVDTKTIGKVYDVERPIQAKKLFNMSEDPGDEGFYKAISENFDKQDAIRDTAKAAARAAIQSSIISKFEETDTGERVDVPWALQYAEHIKERRTPKFEGPEEEKIYQQAFRNAYAQGSAESAETKKIAIDLVAQLEIKEGVEVAGAITQEKPEIFEKLRLLDKEERGRVYAYINANVDSSKVAPDWAKNSTKAVNRGFQRVYGDLKEFELRDHVALIKRNFGTDRPLAYMSEPDPDDTPAERLARISSVNDLGITTDQSRVSRAGAMSVRRVPDEDLKEIVDFMGEVERDLEIQHELQNIRHQKINPIKTDSWFAENVWYPAQAQLGFMATAMSLYTLPVMLTANTQMRAREMVERGASWDDARRMSAISSMLEAPIEYMQVRGVMGGALTRTLRRSKADLSSQLKTLGVSFAGQLVEQNIQEAIQDITPLVVQSLASSLSEEIPGVDWNKELKAYGSERVDTFWALLPFAMLGAGVGSAKDIKNARHYLGNVDRVMALGVDQEVAEEIVELSATDMDAAGKKFAEAEKGEVNLVAFEGEAAIMEDLINSSDRPRITILEDGRAEVAFESGDTQIFPDVDTAQQATSDFVNTRATEARDAVAKLIKGFQDKEVADITVEDRVMLLEDAVLEEEISPEVARQRIKDLSAESGLEFGDNAFSEFRIYARNEAEFNEGVFRNVVRVFKGDNPFAVVEDVSEGLFKKLIFAGERPKLNGWLQQYQEVTGDILLPDIESATDRSMVEAMSALATSFYAGKVQKGSLSNSIKKLFQQLATYFQYVFDRAGRLSEGFKSGELSPEFEAALAESTGLNLEQRQEQATDAAVEAALQEMIADKNADIQKRFDNTFSIGAASMRKQGFNFKSKKRDGSTNLRKGRKEVMGRMSINLGKIADPSKDVSKFQPPEGLPAQMKSMEGGDFYQVADALGLDAQAIAEDKNFRVRRIQGISVPDEYKGMGVGQALRLAHMQDYDKGTTHFYNSQQSPESALSTAALARKGLITITPLGNWMERWKPGMPFMASVTTITEAGRKADPFDLVKPQKVALDIERLRETTSDPLADVDDVDSVQERFDNTFSIAPAQLEQQLESFFAPPDFRMDQLTKAHKMLRDIEIRFAKKRREAGANKTIVQRVDLVEGVAQFEAILKVLPLSIRGKLTGAAAVAGKATDKGRLSYLFNRIDRAAALLDEFIAKDNAAKFEQLVTRSLPKKDASGKLRSTLGPETAQLVTDIAAVMNLDTLSLDGRITQLEEQVGRNLGDVGRVYELIHTAEQFGAIKDMDAIRSSDALELLKSSISSGRNEFRMAQEIRRNRNAELISTAKIEAGAPVTPDPQDVDAVRREEDKAFKKLHEGTKGFLVELLSFRQMLVTVFGYGKTADHFEARAQKAKNEFTDKHLARRKKQEQWLETDLGLTTGRSRIKWLNDLRKVKKTEIKTSTGKSIELSQDEAIYYTMVWDQAAYQSNLEKHNDFTQKTIDQMEDWLTPESKQFRSHLQKEYQKDYDRINAVYRALNGVDMPRVFLYAPVSIDTGNVNDLQVAPFGNSLMASGLAAGFTKLRTNHNMKIRRQGASTTFWAHTQQVDYYVAYADMARELRAVFSDPTVRDGIVLKKGTRRAKTVGMWVDQFHNNGARRAAGLLAMEQFSLRMQRATVLIGLAWNFGTLLKQTSAVFGTLTEIPATAWIRGVGAMLVNPKRFSDVFKSRTVQRRIDAGMSIEMQVAMSSAETSPSMLMAAMRKGLPAIGMVDAAWTSVGGAIAYDYHLREARKAGASEADARKIAEDRLDLTIGRTAQPAANMDRSLTEINMDANAFGRIYMMFKSDPRQKMAIAMMGIRDAIKTPGRKLQGTQAAFTTLVMMTIATKIMDEWFAMAFRDKDEDDMWDLEALGHAITTGQSSGIPFAGEAIELLSGAAFDQQVWAEGSQIGDTAKSLSQGWNKLLAGEFGKEEDELTAKAMTKDINSITRGMGVIIGGRAAAAGVTSRILKDLANLSDFVTDTETWVGPTDFQKKLDELEELDEAIIEAKKDAPADEEKVKLSEDFKRLKALRVGEGTRALGVKALLDSTPEGKKMNLIKELKEAKILTSTVDKQLKKL